MGFVKTIFKVHGAIKKGAIALKSQFEPEPIHRLTLFGADESCGPFASAAEHWRDISKWNISHDSHFGGYSWSKLQPLSPSGFTYSGFLSHEQMKNQDFSHFTGKSGYSTPSVPLEEKDALDTVSRAVVRIRKGKDVDSRKFRFLFKTTSRSSSILLPPEGPTFFFKDIEVANEEWEDMELNLYDLRQLNHFINGIDTIDIGLCLGFGMQVLGNEGPFDIHIESISLQ